MYVCICIYIYTHTHLYIDTYMHTWIQVGKFVVERMNKTLSNDRLRRMVFLPTLSDQDYRYVCMYACMHVCMYTCMYACGYVCRMANKNSFLAAIERPGFPVYVYVCMYVCTYVCMCVCLSVCLYVCMYVCMRVCM